MMTIIADIGRYIRPAQSYSTRTTSTPADGLPATGADDGTAADKKRFPVSELRPIDMSRLKAVSAADIPELRDMMATNWLNMRADEAIMATEVPDNAPQNTYATVKVDGKVVATLYNSGCSVMTNAAAAEVGNLPDPGPTGGPNLAQSRAEYIAKAMGGTIEKATTAITQSQWTPRQTVSRDYTRAQLDAAFAAMTAEGQNAAAQLIAGYATANEASGVATDFKA